MTSTPAARQLRYPTRTLLLIGGPPAVGKSTLARRLLADRPLIELDSYLDGEPPNFTFRYDEFYAAIAAALAANETVIVHMTGLRHGLRRRVARIAETQGAEPHALFLDGDEALTRAGQLARRAERDYIADEVMAEYLENWEYLKFFLRSRADGGPDDREMGEWRSVTVLDRSAVNVLQTISFG